MFSRFVKRFSTTRTVGENAKVGLILVGSVATTSIAFSYFTDSRAGFYSKVLMPLLHQFDPEDTHRWSIWFARVGLVPYEKEPIDDARLKVQLWGKEINNPIGLAAGYDKHGEAIDSLLSFGFGTIEIGSVTPLPQKGNPKPRMFRLTEDEAVINRYGFNSHGHGTVVNRLKNRIRKYMTSKSIDKVEELKLPHSLVSDKLLGINLGKNKSSDAASHDDYVNGVVRLGPLADYIVVNISSPNTPGLRALQRREPIEQLLKAAKSARDEHVQHRPPLLVKIAPDCTDTELEDIAVVAKNVGIDGIIISNTTISRPETLKSAPQLVTQTGGLSGQPVKELAIKTVSKFYKLTNGTIPIIGCGGVKNADDAIRFAKAGASMVQLYTSLGYAGPGIVPRIKQELLERLEKDNKSWKDLIGADHK